VYIDFAIDFAVDFASDFPSDFASDFAIDFQPAQIFEVRVAASHLQYYSTAMPIYKCRIGIKSGGAPLLSY
jgi:hypothetical protein